MYHYSWFWLIPGVEHGAPLEQVHHSLEAAGAGGLVSHGELASFHAVPAAWFAVLICAVLAFAARSGLATARGKGGTEQYVPAANLGPRNAFEMIIEGLLDFMETALHSRKAAVKFLPLVGSIFVYILISNFMGLVPGFLPPTASVSNNMAIALAVFVVFNWSGIKEHGLFGYLKTLGGPVPFMAPFIFVVETLSLFIRPLTLSLRLAINMFADHLLLGVFSDLVPYLVPGALVGLGSFVAFVQAFVFMLLTVVYIALATSHDH
ncbi:MAG: F0F1 ATP synthase subunit A [Proteobacteria bacterium]|nr:F0F1 ATP synthase subunit A [Pseudomonadota bacterium]MCP4916840.1 F0F1 ATP synthase subunit A [Pseudomonadota bacterium]